MGKKEYFRSNGQGTAHTGAAVFLAVLQPLNSLPQH